MRLLILVLHTALFAGFIGVSFGASLYILAYPAAVPIGYVAFVTFALGALVFGSWPLFGGCPLTFWEKRAIRSEGKEPYAGSCVDWYAYRWFGIKLLPQRGTQTLVIFLALPLVSRLIALGA